MIESYHYEGRGGGLVATGKVTEKTDIRIMRLQILEYLNTFFLQNSNWKICLVESKKENKFHKQRLKTCQGSGLKQWRFCFLSVNAPLS